MLNINCFWLVFLTCQWKNCPWRTDKSFTPEFQRHLYLHAYHTKLKCIGQNTLTRSLINVRKRKYKFFV